MKSKWYLQTWVICLMFALWPFFIPPAIGLVFLYLQHKERSAQIAFYGDIDSLDAEKELKQGKISELEEAIATLQEEQQEKATEFRAEIAQLTKEIEDLDNEAVVASYRYSDYDGISSEECKNKLSLLKVQEKDLVRAAEAVHIDSTDPKSVVKNNVKQLIRCFNAECDNALLMLTFKNIDTQRGKIQRSFETLNKVFSTDGMALDTKLLEIKLEQLNLVHTYELKKEQEKEQQKAIREQMVEEEKVRKEIEREKQRIGKEEVQFRNEVSRLMEYMRKANDEVERNLYIDKIKELEGKLGLLEKDKEDVFQREQNTRAGFVYVVSNIGSFGDNIYKIGMTRRLEPMDRVRELSSASVPFPFDVHAMIFSDDAPALETMLHNRFKEFEVNKVNSRKEFFRVALPEIETAVKEDFNATVTFTLIAEAAEYKKSMEIA